MPKRRLHGVTQKRRQKAKSAALKRSQSPRRISATQAPAGFERKREVGRQDIEFLEAMRELRVQPNRRRPINLERLKNLEQVRFLSDSEGEAEFLHAMERMGVRPLHSGGPQPAPGLRRNRPIPANLSAAPEDDSGPPDTAHRAIPPGSVLIRAAERIPHDVRATAAAKPPVSRGVSRPPAPEPIEFIEEPLDMAALLLESLDPARKYEGAPPPKRPKAELPPDEAESDEAEPDDELDLHGKTMEEAIRMVQNFLRSAHQKRFRSVVIVTGRGLNSGKEGPVLRGAVLTWLERNGGPYCREFGQAPGRHGGAGALWVRMR
jgi:hypothetical protein